MNGNKPVQLVEQQFRHQARSVVESSAFNDWTNRQKTQGGINHQVQQTLRHFLSAIPSSPPPPPGAPTKKKQDQTTYPGAFPNAAFRQFRDPADGEASSELSEPPSLHDPACRTTPIVPQLDEKPSTQQKVPSTARSRYPTKMRQNFYITNSHRRQRQ